jgi:hypothetical protein
MKFAKQMWGRLKSIWNLETIKNFLARSIKWVAVTIFGGFITTIAIDYSNNRFQLLARILPDDWVHQYTMPDRWSDNIPVALRFNEASQLFVSFQKSLEDGNRRVVFKPKSLALARICRSFNRRTLSVANTFDEFAREFSGCFDVRNRDGETIRVVPQTQSPEIENPETGLFYCRCPDEVVDAKDRPPLDRDLLKVLPISD